MGCFPADYTNCREDESPFHQVTLTHGFWMGQTLVPQAAYQRLMGKNPSHYRLVSDRPFGFEILAKAPVDPNPGSFNADLLPVDSVTWVDAQKYCRAAGMRLPTEAEFEFAARTGNSVHEPPAKDGQGSLFGLVRPYEVRFNPPNELGISDLLNNGWEWVEDRYDRYKPGPVTDPKGPAASVGDSRVLRGALPQPLQPLGNRLSQRSTLLPDVGNPSVVFRCAGN